MENPYQSPSAAVTMREGPSDRLDDVVSGQKHVIYAILLYFAAAFLRVYIGPLAFLVILLCVGLSWAGIYKLSRGLGYPMWGRIALLLMMLVPLVGLVVLLFLSSRATSRLKDAGYSVGLMGARNY